MPYAILKFQDSRIKSKTQTEHNVSFSILNITETKEHAEFLVYLANERHNAIKPIGGIASYTIKYEIIPFNTNDDFVYARVIYGDEYTYSLHKENGYPIWLAKQGFTQDLHFIELKEGLVSECRMQLS